MDRGFDVLEKVGWLGFLTENEARKLLASAGYVSRPPGAVVFYQDDIDDSVYLIANGRAGVWKALASGDEKFVRELSAGQCFGELSALDPAPRSTTIRTITKCEFVVLRATPFRECLERNGRLAVTILINLVRQVRADDKRLEPRRSVNDRLLCALQELSRGKKKFEDGSVSLRVSRAALALRCEADIKTISRELTKLEQSGRIFRAGHAIIVRNVEP